MLALCTVIAAFAVAGDRYYGFLTPAPAPVGPPAKLEVVVVEDELDPFQNVEPPPGEGIEIRFTNVPTASGQSHKVYFAYLTLRDRETKDAAHARFQRWLTTIPLPAGARFGLEAQWSAEEEAPRLDGLRTTYVLGGESALRTGDIVAAEAMLDTHGGSPGYHVNIELSPPAAERFEAMTRAWTWRRIAIVVDDEVMSAPIVSSAISGGHASIMVGWGDLGVQLDEAKRPAARLHPRP